MAIDLEKVDVYEFLNDLGLNNIREERNDVWYSCFSDAHYRGDVNPSASMEKGTTRFYCFSCGMHGNAVSFLAEYENVSPIQAAIWIKEKFGGSKAPERSNILDNVKEILKDNKKTYATETISVIEETEATRRKIDWRSEQAWIRYSGPDITEEDKPAIYMLNRGFTSEVLDKFDIGFDKISGRICIPIRNEEGALIGFKGRSLKHNEKTRYIVLGGPEYGFEPYMTKKVIFGLDKIEETEDRSIILCEGELNAIAMHQNGFTNAVGISGKILSDEQVELIIKFADKVILIFDDQEDAVKAANKLRLKIPTYIVPEHNRDPADMSRQELIELVSSRVSALV